MDKHILIPHLFRQESGKIIAVIARHWGVEHIETAEDIAAETFLRALETWPYKGVPENPVAWLYRVARNLSYNYLKRNKIIREKQKTWDSSNPDVDSASEHLFDDANIRDGQLKMLFAICNTSIPTESQIMLALRILCGFGIEEIANAFLTNKDQINKRLYRAKEKLRHESTSFHIYSSAIWEEALEPVLTTLYLLFNEGYYSENHQQIIRKDLCLEALRLTNLLTEQETTNKPETNALLALMSFQSSRFEARMNPVGEMILYEDQDVRRWDRKLIDQGIYYLRLGARGNKISRYHLEASIAYFYTLEEHSQDKWENILELFDQLLLLSDHSMIRLNRIYAYSKVYGERKAIEDALKIEMPRNKYYALIMGFLYREIDRDKSRNFFQQAYQLTKSEVEKNYIKKKYLEG